MIDPGYIFDGSQRIRYQKYFFHLETLLSLSLKHPLFVFHYEVY